MARARAVRAVARPAAAVKVRIPSIARLERPATLAILSLRLRIFNEGDIVEYRHVREQRVVLKDHADGSPMAATSVTSSPSRTMCPVRRIESAIIINVVVLPSHGPSSVTITWRDVGEKDSTATPAA